MTTPDGELVFCALASIPALGNALAISAEGDAVLRIEVAPQSVADLTAVLQRLRLRTFYVALIGKPKVTHASEERTPTPGRRKPRDPQPPDKDRPRRAGRPKPPRGGALPNR